MTGLIVPLILGLGGTAGGGGGDAAIRNWAADPETFVDNEIAVFAGGFYRNTTGVNTAIDPSLDTVNWTGHEFTGITQANFDIKDLAGELELGIKYDITDAPVTRGIRVRTVADIAARDLLDPDAQEGDITIVLLTAIGLKQSYVWGLTEWDLIQANEAVGATLTRNTTQALLATNTKETVIFDSVESSNKMLVGVPPVSEIQSLVSGKFWMAVNAQIMSSGGANRIFEFSFEVDTGGGFVLIDKSSSYGVIDPSLDVLFTKTLPINLDVGDKVRVRWAANNTVVILDTPTSLVGDSIPSVTLNLTYIGE